MKKTFLFFTTLFSLSTIFSQAPAKINYQAVVRNSTGDIVAETNVPVIITINDGTNSYIENYSSVNNQIPTNKFGLINLVIGQGNLTIGSNTYTASVTGSISNINWSSSNVTITTNINSISQSTTLHSVPYALFANQVKNYPESGTDGYYLKWEDAANNNNGAWVAAAVSTGTTLPNGSSNGEVLTWDATANSGSGGWIAAAAGNSGTNLPNGSSNGEVLTWDATANNGSGGWIAAAAGNSGTNLPNGSSNGEVLTWDATANSGSGGWIAAAAGNSGTNLPNGSSSGEVLTWDATANSGAGGWTAQNNDGFEADDQMSNEVMLDPPFDYNSDQIDETTVQEALTAIHGELSSGSGSSNYWTNPQNSTNVITQNQQANVGIGLITDPDEELHVDGTILVKNTSEYGTKITIENDDLLGANSTPSNAAGIELLNYDPNSASSYSHFEIVNQKNDDGLVSTSPNETKQDEFKIRRNERYNPTNPQPQTPLFRDYLTIEGDEGEIGIMTSNPHATLSVGGNSTGNGSANVAIGQNFAVYNPGSPYNETNDQIPNNSLIVEGKVGVATMDPQSQLDVRGSVRIGGGYAGNSTITSDPTNGLIVEGSVGIGMSDPNLTYKLDIDGKTRMSSTATNGGVLKIGNATQTSGDVVIIDGATGQNALKINTGKTVLNGDLTITNGQPSPSSTFSVTNSNGNTSISGTLSTTGATSLLSTLDVTGNSTLSGNLGVTGATSLSSTLSVTGDGSFNNDLNAVGIISFGELSDGTLNMLGFVDDDSFSNATEATLPSSESVKAYVDNKVATTYASGLSNSLIAGSGVDFSSGSSFNGSSTNTISVDVTDFMTNGVDNQLITATGADGINSEANLTFDGTTLDVTGKIVSNGIEELSDKRWKKDITSIDQALEKIKAMNGVYYYWKKDEFPEKNFTGKRQIGFLAQDLELILPEAVHTNEQGYKSVSYGHTVALLVEAIKELEEMIEKQSKIIHKQQIDIQQLKSNNANYTTKKSLISDK